MSEINTAYNRKEILIMKILNNIKQYVTINEETKFMIYYYVATKIFEKELKRR